MEALDKDMNLLIWIRLACYLESMMKAIELNLFKEF